MKPNPFSSLNHLTVPVGMWSVPPGLKCCYRGGCAAHTPEPAPASCRRSAAFRRGTYHDARGKGAIATLRTDRRHVIIWPMDDPMPLGAMPRSRSGGHAASVALIRSRRPARERHRVAHRGDLRRRGLDRADRRAEAAGDRALRSARDRGRPGRAQPDPQPRARARAAAPAAHQALAIPRRAARPRPTARSVHRRLDSKRRQAERKRDRHPAALQRPDALASYRCAGSSTA